MKNRSFPPLVEAALRGDLRTVRQLLETKGTDINAKSEDGESTALMVAARGNHISMLDVLLLWGADINLVNIHGNSALMIASEKGYFEIVYRLLVEKAALKIKNLDCNSALGLAIKEGHCNVVHKLLFHGANPNTKIDGGMRALQYVAERNNLPIARELLAYQANIDRIIKSEALEAAVSCGHMNMVLLLLTSYEEDMGGKALIWAASKGHEKIVGALLANHVNIDITNDLGQTALMVAIDGGHFKVISVLLSHPEVAKTINQADNDKDTALLHAVRSMQVLKSPYALELLRDLLTAGADPNLKNSHGCTVLYLYNFDISNAGLFLLGLTHDNTSLIRELLIWGANTQHRNDWDATPLDFSKLYNKPAVPIIEEHIKETENYDGLKKEMESFFSGTVKLSEAKFTFSLFSPLVAIIGDYACPVKKLK